MLPFLFALFMTTPAQALDISRNNPIPHTVGYYITPTGQEFLFKQELERIIFNYGFTMRKAELEGPFAYSDKEINIHNLPTEYSKVQGVLHDVADTLRKYFFNSELGNPLLSVIAKDLDLSLELAQLSLSVVPVSMETEGVKLKLTIDIPRLKVRAGDIVAEDLHNDFIGKIYLKNVQATIDSRQKPLHIELTFNAHIDAKGELKLEDFSSKTNVGELEMNIDYQKPLRAPDIEQFKFVSPKRTMPFNIRGLEEDLDLHKHRLVKVLQIYIQKAVREDLPKKLNEMFLKLSRAISEVTPFPPPGVDKSLKPEPFHIGLLLDRLVSKPNLLSLQITGFIENPDTSTPLADSARHLGPPTLLNETHAYDVAFTVNQQLINRFIQFTFDRKYFNKIALKKGPPIELTKLPVVDLTQGTCRLNQREFKIRVKAGVALDLRAAGAIPVEGIKGKLIKIGAKWSVKNPVKVDGILWLKASIGSNGRIDLSVDSLDENNFEIDRDSYRAFGKAVDAIYELKSIAQKQIKKLNKELDSKAAPKNLPLPPNFTGLANDVHTICPDPNGHLVIYMKKVPSEKRAAEEAKAIAITGLGEFRGKYLSLYHVSGHMSTMGIDLPGQRPKVNRITHGPLTTSIGSSGSVELGLPKIKQEGFQTSNLLTFIVHESPEISLGKEQLQKEKFPFLCLQTHDPLTLQSVRASGQNKISLNFEPEGCLR